MPTAAQMKAYISVYRRKKEEYEGRFRLLAETMFAIQMEATSEARAPELFSVGCPAGVLTCAINERGLVMPCSFFTARTAGNAVEESFDTVWRSSPLFKELRHREDDSICGSCVDQPTCGGCRARSYGIHGELHQDDPFCSKVDGQAVPVRIGQRAGLMARPCRNPSN